MVWRTSSGSTINDNKTEDGTGTGYGEEESITTSATPTTVTDIDGNIYNTIQIGDQIWMKENLKTSRYNIGSPIPYVEYNESWSTLNTGAWSYYNHDENNNAIYG